MPDKPLRPPASVCPSTACLALAGTHQAGPCRRTEAITREAPTSPASPWGHSSGFKPGGAAASPEGAPACRRLGLAGPAGPRLVLPVEGPRFLASLPFPLPAHPGLGSPRAKPHQLFLPWKVEPCN